MGIKQREQLLLCSGRSGSPWAKNELENPKYYSKNCAGNIQFATGSIQPSSLSSIGRGGPIKEYHNCKAGKFIV